MATFDQLSAEQRAILELVLQRGQSYDDLASTLGMPAGRVRELARDALGELAPVTAKRVDPDWRGQLADYVLGQQSGPESTATRGHLRRSEPARAWARSVLDSLDGLYRDGLPTIPEPDRSVGRGERPRRGAQAAEKQAEEEGRGGGLSPGARAAIRRRRLVAAAAAGALVLAFAILIFPGKVLTGGDDEEGEPARAQQAGQRQPRILGQVVLRPVKGEDGAGIAVIAERGGQSQLIVQARLKPSGNREAYEVWLYNNQEDARSIGAQVTDRQGTYQGAGPLPQDFDRYKFIDISREPVDRNRRHSGDSVLRGRLDQLEPPPAGAGGAPQGGTPPPGGQGQAPPPTGGQGGP
jgi:hypothetical protein